MAPMAVDDVEREGWLGVLWALVIIQGAITVLSALEALVVSVATGTIIVAWPIVALTTGGAVLALAAARGLHRRSRWAQRVSVIAEVIVLGSGLVNLALSLFLADAFLDLVPTLTTIAAPIAVLLLIRETAPLFDDPRDEMAETTEMVAT